MQNEETYSKKLSLVKTKEQVDQFKKEIDVLVDGLYKSDMAISEKDRGQKESFFKDLKNKLDNFETMRLTISFVPTEEFITKIFDWARQNISETVIFDIDFKAEIIGGVLVEWKGKYLDLSLAHHLEEKYGL